MPSVTSGPGSSLMGVDTKLTEIQREDLGKMLGNPILFPKEFKSWLADFLATNIPMIPFSHVFGAKVNIARSGDFVATSESTTSASYTNLATDGPGLTNLADGTYLIAWGVTSRQRSSISVNGATPSDDDSLIATECGPAGARMKIVSMKNEHNNSVKIQYKNGTFSKRWITVIRIGSPGE